MTGRSRHACSVTPMPKNPDISGQSFGRLVAQVRLPENTKAGQARWRCICEPTLGGCGNSAVVIIGNLRNGNTQSCGCLNKEAVKASNTSHGMRGTQTYEIWCGIKKRCYNRQHVHYNDYGGRGITMCEEWRKNFEAFYHDMGERPSPQHSIDRRDNDKGYFKENCRWATQVEQQNNTRKNIFYLHDGVYKTLATWCRELKLDYRIVYQRIQRYGWSFEKAIVF